jgi:hypothetical protein
LVRDVDCVRERVAAAEGERREGAAEGVAEAEGVPVGEGVLLAAAPGGSEAEGEGESEGVGGMLMVSSAGTQVPAAPS